MLYRFDPTYFKNGNVWEHLWSFFFIYFISSFIHFFILVLLGRTAEMLVVSVQSKIEHFDFLSLTEKFSDIYLKCSERLRNKSDLRLNNRFSQD